MGQTQCRVIVDGETIDRTLRGNTNAWGAVAVTFDIAYRAPRLRVSGAMLRDGRPSFATDVIWVTYRGADGRPLSKAAQVRMCGNSVCPTLAEALVRANYSERQALRKAA